MQRIRESMARGLPWGVAIALLAGMNRLHPAGVSLVGLGVGVTLVGAAVYSQRRRLDRTSSVAVLLMATSLLWLLTCAVLADNPLVSLVGTAGSHNGAVIWALGFAWFLAGILAGDGHALRRTGGVIAAGGALFSTAAFFERFTSGAERAQGYAAGFFENSNSLGAFLAVAALAGVMTALTSRRPLTRWLAYAAAAVSAAGITVTSSRTGLIALLAGGVWVLLLGLIPASRTRNAAVSIGVPVVAAAASALGVAASLGRLGPALQDVVAGIGTDRDAIWRAAYAQIERSPLLGVGPDRFSAVITWGLGPNDGTFTQFTSHPHSLVLAIVIGGGLLGALLIGASAAALLWKGSELQGHSTRKWAAAFVTALPVAVIAEGLVNWVPPSAMLAVAAVMGTAFGASLRHVPAEGRQASRAPLTVIASVIAVLAGASLFALSAWALPSEVVAARAAARPGDYALVAEQVEAYRRFPEPELAVQALRSQTRQVWLGNTDAAAQAVTLVQASSRDARWRASLAVTHILAEEAIVENGHGEFGRYLDAVERGVEADPSSGLWYAMAAREASQRGEAMLAAEYATKAQEYPMDNATREVLEQIAE